jgi:MraZ protein
MFLGSVRTVIDERGKLALPERWRAELLGGAVLTLSVDPCLYIFPRDKFEAIVREVDQLGMELADSRNWSRYLSGPATELEIDRTGSIEIPEPLRQFAGLQQEANLIGVTSRIEVWNPSKRQESESRELAQMKEIAERIGKIMRTTRTEN